MAKRKRKELIFYCSRNIVVVKCFLDTNLNIPSLLNRAQKEKLGVPFQTSSDFSASLFLASLHTQGSLAKALLPSPPEGASWHTARRSRRKQQPWPGRSNLISRHSTQFQGASLLFVAKSAKPNFF